MLFNYKTFDLLNTWFCKRCYRRYYRRKQLRTDKKKRSWSHDPPQSKPNIAPPRLIVFNTLTFGGPLYRILFVKLESTHLHKLVIINNNEKKIQYYIYNAFIYSSYFSYLFIFLNYSWIYIFFFFCVFRFSIFNYTFCYRQASQIIALYFACFP